MKTKKENAHIGIAMLDGIVSLAECGSVNAGPDFHRAFDKIAKLAKKEISRGVDILDKETAKDQP